MAFIYNPDTENGYQSSERQGKFFPHIPRTRATVCGSRDKCPTDVLQIAECEVLSSQQKSHIRSQFAAHGDVHQKRHHQRGEDRCGLVVHGR